MTCFDCLFFKPLVRTKCVNLREICNSVVSIGTEGYEFVEEKWEEYVDETRGRCHRFPPPISEEWPVVPKTGWCGEYRWNEDRSL